MKTTKLISDKMTDHAVNHPRETIWIIGYGKFGHRALEKLQEKISPRPDFVIVEQTPPEQKQVGIKCICSEGAEWLAHNFKVTSRIDKIVPALPVHLAAEWVKKRLLSENRIVTEISISNTILHQLPHPYRLSQSSVAVSHANFICPSNCPEPEEICTYTGKKRPLSLYRFLEEKNYGEMQPIIIRSHQFAAGVGGFYPDDLWSLLHEVKRFPDRPLLIGTACKCHGIIDAFRFC